MLYLMPQSNARMRGVSPSPKTRVCFVETCATRFVVFGSWSGGAGLPASAIVPSVAPLSRSRRVSARVSTPWIAGMPCATSHSPSERVRGPVRVEGRVVRDDERRDVHARRLEVARQAVRVDDVLGRHAVVADERVRQHEDLAAVRRIRQRLGVPDHAGVEDDLARRGLARAERVALIDGAVREREPRAVRLVGAIWSEFDAIAAQRLRSSG